jgi:hypothetical protein
MDLVIPAVVLNVHGVAPRLIYSVMAGLVPAIHVFANFKAEKTWMPGIADKLTPSAQA